MRGLIVAVLFLVGVPYGVTRLYREMATDSTKVRWVVTEFVDAFNANDMDTAIAYFAPDYADESNEEQTLNRASIHAALLAAARSVDPQTKKPKLELKTGEELIRIVELDTGAGTALISLEVSVRERGAGGRVVWKVKGTASLRRGDEGWKIVRTAHETVVGARPGD
jgi:ketosteroid isomerase-like protein